MRMTQDMDDDEKGKLFVGGLSWETSQENLQRYFSRYGEVIDCVVMKNSESGRSRGFGFVTFAEPSLVNVVLQSGPHQLDGRTIDPKPCNPRTLQKPKKGGGYPKVFLGGLPSNVTETDLRMFFARYGKVMEVVIMYDQEKKKSRGFGFLSFEEELSVERVTQEHFINLNGKQVEIKRAEPRDGGGKAGAEGAWGPAGAAPLAHGHNGQLGGPGPPLGVPLGQVQPGLVQGYQGWGASPGQGYGGYGAGGPGYAGWGAPPQPQPQWPAAQYQHGHQHPGQAPQPQSYQTYSQGYANSGYSNSGPAGGSTGGNWNNWNMPQNSTSTGSGKCESPVSEGNYDTWEAPSVQHNPPPSMSSTSQVGPRQMAMLYGSDPMTQQPQPAYCDEYVDASGGAGDYQRPAKRSHHSTPAVSAAASYHPYRR